jgi:sugar/nucleoside kinase (ribokinase family)
VNTAKGQARLLPNNCKSFIANRKCASQGMPPETAGSIHRSYLTLIDMSERTGILVVGNWIVDHIKVIDIWPSQDGLANIKSEHRGTGGAPFNVSAGLSKLGARFPISAAGIIGRDEPGEWILETCEAHEIDTTLMRQTMDAPTSYTDVMTVERTGRRTFFHQKGANSLLDIQSIDLNRSNAKILHLGYLLLLDRLDVSNATFGTNAGELLHLASELGFVTSADLVSEESERFSTVVLPTLPYLDLIFLNELEAGRTFNMNIRENDVLNVSHLLEAVDLLLQAGVRHWVIVHFPEGVLAASKDGDRLFQPSLLLPQDFIVGSAGAGDAIASGVLLGYHEGASMNDSLLYGVCTAAASLRHPSCTEGIEPIDDCAALAKKFGFRPSII